MLIVGPLLGALIALVGRRGMIQLGLALGSVSGLTGSAALWWTLAGGDAVRHPLGGWGAPLGIELRADALSVAMLSVTAIAGAAVSLYATSYFGNTFRLRCGGASAERGGRYFAPLWLLLWTGLNGAYLSGDLFNLYVTLEVVGLTAASIVTLAATTQALVAGMRYLLVSLVGSLLFLFGVALLYIVYGVLSLEGLAAAVPANGLPVVALAAMTVGLAMKTALFPFHGWLPPAHASAPAPGSAILSALVVKASFYILLRLWMEVYGGGARTGLLILGVMGAAAILWGSIMALRQVSLKRLVAYSTVAQLGYLVLIFPFLDPAAGDWSGQAWTGGVFHALSHAVAKAAMFLAAGSMTYAMAHDALPSLAGIAHRRPLSYFAFGVAGLSLAGIPPSGGFVSKWLMLRSAAESGAWVCALVIAVGGLLTAAYVLLVMRSGLGRPDPTLPFQPVPRRMEWCAVALALLAVGMGIWPSAILDLIRSGAPWR